MQSKALIFCQSPKNIEQAREQLYALLAAGEKFNSKIVTSIKEFEQENQVFWDVIYIEKIYKDKFTLSTDKIIYL